MSDKSYQDALNYHSAEPAGKVEVRATKPSSNKNDLSLAYSPGVAAPCQEIHKNPMDVFKYTNKGNLVAVISNGSAVLGLGNIGALASKPVMEGKSVLFKTFAGLDSFDLELNCNTVESFVQTVKALEPTFGGVNLEDIKAPECFEIEEQLKKSMNIPVFHDDQHGTAIISSAALLNACLLQKKKLSKIKVVFMGAGAAALSCANMFHHFGVKKKNIVICDSKGVIYKDRKENMNSYKQAWATDRSERTLEKALVKADVFCGLSVGNLLEPKSILKMNSKPIIFALANPTPEINPDKVYEICPDAIVATGRTDYPNQVNNVLGFPGIFRGALDVRAKEVNMEMKKAATLALAKLARKEVPDEVSRADTSDNIFFGRNYIIPKPFDSRVLSEVACAVAKAAMDSKVAQDEILDFSKYEAKINKLQGLKNHFLKNCIQFIEKRQSSSKERPKLIFADGDCNKVLKAVASFHEQNLFQGILVGSEKSIRSKIEKLNLSTQLSQAEIWDPTNHPNLNEYQEFFYKKHNRRGILKDEAHRLAQDPYYFATLATRLNHAQGMVCGSTRNYADAIKPLLLLMKTPLVEASALNIALLKDRILILSDTAVQVDPSVEDLVNIARNAGSVATYLGLTPRVAFLSYSNFTQQKGLPEKMAKAAYQLKKRFPNFLVDGDIQADAALNTKISSTLFPFSDLSKESANVLIFPNLAASNIGYKLLKQLSEADIIGPFLIGLSRPAHIVQRTGFSDDIVQTITMTLFEIYKTNNPKA